MKLNENFRGYFCYEDPPPFSSLALTEVKADELFNINRGTTYNATAPKEVPRRFGGSGAGGGPVEVR